MMLTTRVLTSFDSDAVSPQVWSRLLPEGQTDVVALTWHEQRNWWSYNARGRELMLVLVEDGDRPIAIAPLFSQGKMAVNLCPANTLDFVGSVDAPDVMDAILRTAWDRIPSCKEIRLYFIPDTSTTGERLASGARRLGLECRLEGEEVSPFVDLGIEDHRRRITHQKTARRRENQLRRLGALVVSHFRDWGEVGPQLDTMFDQHVARWAGTATPSKYLDPDKRAEFRATTRDLAELGWLRFSTLELDGRPIAFHRGTLYAGRFRYARSSFDPAFAELSPGTVLLRHLVLQAIEEGAWRLELGMGDEPYKARYSSGSTRLQTWVLSR